MPTLSPMQVHEKITQAAKQFATTDTRIIPDSMKVGQSIRQGDVYLTRIAKIPKEHTKVSTNPQIVEGSTQGSRHLLRESDMKHIKVLFNPSNNTPTLGPVIEATERFQLTHPEHAHFDMPAGIYSVTYQMNWADKERVRD